MTYDYDAEYDWGIPTPDRMLFDIRFLVRKASHRLLDPREVKRLADLVDDLDEHLSHHGDWPTAWRKGIPPVRWRPVEDLPPL